MQALFRKAKHYLKLVKSTEFSNVTKIDNITYCPADYKEDNTPPPLADFVPFKNGDSFGTGNDSHAWFHFTIDLPENMQGTKYYQYGDNKNEQSFKAYWDKIKNQK